MNRWVLGFIAILISIPESHAEEKNRKDFSGRDLFEHHWQWTGPAKRPSAVERMERRRKQRPDSETTLLQNGDIKNGDGLGPLHNATSCADCHINGGGAGVRRNVTMITIDPRVRVTDEKAAFKTTQELFPGIVNADGTLQFHAVVHDRSTRAGYDKIRKGLTHFVPGGLNDAWFDPESRTVDAIASQPVIAGRHHDIDFYLSQRQPPPLWGLGVIDRINPVRIEAIAKKQASRTDGEITGRFVSRFGWRGQIDSLSQFVTAACAGELGLNPATAIVTSSNREGFSNQLLAGGPMQAPDPADPTYMNVSMDMTPEEMSKLIMFVSKIPRPIEQPRDGDTIAEVLRGEAAFNRIGCVQCHVPDIHPVSGIFSDLLLHDMGPGLQSPMPSPIGRVTSVLTFSAPRVTSTRRTRLSVVGAGFYSSGMQRTLPQPYPIERPEQPRFPRGEVPPQKLGEFTWDALQLEWRTPPLWGVADTAPYLHDGRAKTLRDAIWWHGGEAQSSRDRFMELPESEQQELIAFLSSLRAPQID